MSQPERDPEALHAALVELVGVGGIVDIETTADDLGRTLGHRRPDWIRADMQALTDQGRLCLISRTRGGKPIARPTQVRIM
jgi:hypothetical protein